MGNVGDVLDELRDLTANGLASRVDVYSPNGPESEGAEYLKSVRDSVVEAIEYYPQLITGEDGQDTWMDMAHEQLDAVVPVYTYPAWMAFVDLGGWEWDRQVEPSTGDLTDVAKGVLLEIGEALGAVLVEQARERFVELERMDEED